MWARDLGIAIGDGTPGAKNAITDIPDVRVGHTTLIEGDSVRTGVTIVVPPETPHSRARTTARSKKETSAAAPAWCATSSKGASGLPRALWTGTSSAFSFRRTTAGGSVSVSTGSRLDS